MNVVSYHRLVALGDSQTEGLNDFARDGTPRGWVDRFAESLATTTSPDLTYANLAVRGCRARHVTETQLPIALALEPDLAIVAVGMNDVLRHDFEFAEVAGHIDRCVAALSGTGARVLMMTFPDISRMLPVMGWLRPREAALNREIGAIAGRYGADLLDLFPLAICGDRAMWSRDRIHGSRLGHRRIAAAMAELLELPGADGTWRDPISPPASRLTVVRRDSQWLATFLGPFLMRQLLGRGTGADGAPKRPSLTPVRRASLLHG